MSAGMRIGLLTGGGDCPGLNAVLRAVTRKSITVYGHEVLGFRNGWRGLLDDQVMPLNLDAVEDILGRGGTILGSSRTNPYNEDDGVARIKDTLARRGIGALVAIGGEDTLGVAERLHREGVPVVGVPKTIDNDLDATDYTFGFDTAVHIATESIDRLRTTAESHHRALVVEVMGRHAGWIALHSGLAGGANVILGPEQRFGVERVAEWVWQRFERQYAPIIVVAEGAVPEAGEELLQTGEKDAFGHVRLGGVGTWLAEELAQRCGKESRAVVLGHTQRGGTPTAYDRVLATRFGLHAVDAVAEGDFGTMVALRGTDIARVPLGEATAKLKTVPLERYAEAEALFG